MAQAVGFGIVFAGPLRLEARALQQRLRDAHLSMAAAEVALEVLPGSLHGEARWGEDRVRIVGFDAPLPKAVLDLCLPFAHLQREDKARIRAHRSHLLVLGDGDGRAIERLLSVAAACACIVQGDESALGIVHEAARTVVPPGLLAAGGGDLLDDLASLPLPLLYTGFSKLDLRDLPGVWMRTHAAHVLGLPELARLAVGHAQAEETLIAFDQLLRYQLDAGEALTAGDELEVEDGSKWTLRERAADETWLDSEGPLLVVE